MSRETLRIFQWALNHFGRIGQVDKTKEEMSELSVALSHFADDKVTIGDVTEEIADVWIMVNQMRIAFGADLVDEMIETKLKKLAKRIDFPLNMLEEDLERLMRPQPKSAFDNDERWANRLRLLEQRRKLATSVLEGRHDDLVCNAISSSSGGSK